MTKQNKEKKETLEEMFERYLLEWWDGAMWGDADIVRKELPYKDLAKLALEEALECVGEGGLPEDAYRSHIGSVADYTKKRGYYIAKEEIRKRLKERFV